MNVVIDLKMPQLSARYFLSFKRNRMGNAIGAK
jgi:hypothetical protein